MKVFLTGGHGFLGKALAASLSKGGHLVTAPRRAEADLTDGGSLEKYAKEKYDRVYHLAAWTQAGDFCLTHAGEQWLINQKLNTTALSWWRRHQPQAKLISIGTSCSYPPGAGLLEKDYMSGEPIESLYTYAMTKRMLYAGQQALHKQFGLTHLTVVPSTLYGPDYPLDGRQMHFIFDLIRKIIRAKELGETAVLWGDGHQRREVVFREDFIALLEMLAGTQENDLINIGAGEDYSIREFAEMICRAVGYPVAKIKYDESRYVGAGQKSLDIRKLRGLFPDFRFTPLSEGLQKTIDWFYAAKAFETKDA